MTAPANWRGWMKTRAAALTAGCLGVAVIAVFALHQRQERVVFSRDIRPILNQNCVACHGGVRQRNDVSFIYREEALGHGKSGKPVIIPGDPDHSELMIRVLSYDAEDHMPYHGPRLSDQQVALLRRWIKEGAQWDDYWAFEAPAPQKLPSVKDKSWPRMPEDRFLLAALEQQGLHPSPEADKAELLRRVSLDLTGLPPSPEEERAFLADNSPNAYEKVVERLLGSPRYGERWASMWLDLARYADSRGYEKDLARPGVWPYRDWVIDAFNRNLPYDRFIEIQMAGDLLPNATLEDRIATSFHRQTPVNDEGGTDDEEFRTVAAMDRVATTWSVVNGVTMNCVQCHSHPYDPIRHVDYYKSLAFFNTQSDADLLDDSPLMKVPKDKAKYAEVQQIEDGMTARARTITEADRDLFSRTKWQSMPIEKAVSDETPALAPQIPDLQKRLAEAVKDTKLPADKKAEKLRDLHKRLSETTEHLARANKSGPAATFQLVKGEALASAETPTQSFYELTARSQVPITAIRIEVPPIHEDTARHTPEMAFLVDRMQVWSVDSRGQKTRVPLQYVARDAEPSTAGALALIPVPPPAKPDPKAPKPAPDKDAEPVPTVFLAPQKLFHTRWIVVVPQQPIAAGVIQVDLKQTKTIDDKPAIIQRVRLATTADSAWTAIATARTQPIAEWRDLNKRLAAIPTVPVPVMVEQPTYERRDTLEFDRGNFLTKAGPNLDPGTPSIFPGFPAGQPHNRLTLARWFFDPRQPLTARVTVNRYWQELFGTGIVETLENFGSVGELPSNQPLLDWLALHFQNDLHWDMKALLRELVLSAAYRQSASATPQMLERDPRNRLLARGPQQRLTAEMVRDQALVASGLLSAQMGGVPVMPPQPEGIWNAVYSSEKWTDAAGPNRYRRAVYTFTKRTAGYPSMLIFDASDRDVSLPRRIPTNTPLQALVLLNDPVYQEAAEALAKRTQSDTAGGKAGPRTSGEIDTWLAYETRLVLSREPTEGELRVLRKTYLSALGSPQPTLVKTSAVKTSATPQPTRETFALTAVGSVLFNLDAAMTR
jgi:hypothetical protein